ncbi:PaaI family thioesterase [Streptomyces sp. NPDC058572]|uniref:PaaI family thioesterase n=1 Tax=Streptomyces sp. NPDC058572 TaxID=3346546 RepID=UPI00365D8310
MSTDTSDEQTLAPARSRTHTWGAPVRPGAGILKMTGREILQAGIDGRFPAAPIMSTLGFRFMEVGDGLAVFETEHGEYLYNPMGSVHGGYLASVMDAALGSAVMSRLPAGSTYTTTQLSLNLIRPVFADTRPLRVTGTAVHVGRTTATAEARVVGIEDGKLYAHGTTTCSVFSFPSA